MGDEQASPAEIQEHLGGIDYPVGKRDLVAHAEGKNAPPDVISVLERLPEREYRSPIDVSESVGRIE